MFLEDIVGSIAQIEQYTQGLSGEDFSQDRLVQDAVIRRLEIIGEAVKNLPEELRLKYPNVPWRQIAGLRDILLTDTLESTWSASGWLLKRICQTLKSRLPKFCEKLETSHPC